MSQLDIQSLKYSINIVDVIGRHVNLKKSGDNYFGCCPFHSEKTPSFSVSESKQFYHCFGCGAQGDVVEFVMEYSGLEFIDAYKDLGGEIELMPSEKVKQNRIRSSQTVKEKVPPDHKQDEVKAGTALMKMKKTCDIANKYIHERGIAYPVYTANRQLVNAAIFPDGQPMRFIAGGMSYNGFTPIKVNDTNKFVACSSIQTGRVLACDYGVNVAVCWHHYVMKYICMWNYGELTVNPLITDSDDNYLCYEMDFFTINNNQLANNKRLD